MPPGGFVKLLAERSMTHQPFNSHALTCSRAIQPDRPKHRQVARPRSIVCQPATKSPPTQGSAPPVSPSCANTAEPSPRSRRRSTMKATPCWATWSKTPTQSPLRCDCGSIRTPGVAIPNVPSEPRERIGTLGTFRLGDSPQTLAEFGETHELSRERIRQIEARAISKLRHPAVARLWSEGQRRPVHRIRSALKN